MQFIVPPGRHSLSPSFSFSVYPPGPHVQQLFCTKLEINFVLCTRRSREAKGKLQLQFVFPLGIAITVKGSRKEIFIGRSHGSSKGAIVITVATISSTNTPIIPL